MRLHRHDPFIPKKNLQLTAKELQMILDWYEDSLERIGAADRDRPMPLDEDMLITYLRESLEGAKDMVRAAIQRELHPQPPRRLVIRK